MRVGVAVAFVLSGCGLAFEFQDPQPSIVDATIRDGGRADVGGSDAITFPDASMADASMVDASIPDASVVDGSSPCADPSECVGGVCWNDRCWSTCMNNDDCPTRLCRGVGPSAELACVECENATECGTCEKCEAGSCVPDQLRPQQACYRDEDDDGYGAGPPITRCGSCADGEVPLDGDCHPTVRGAHPGAGFSRRPVPGTTPPSWDWDCSMTIELQAMQTGVICQGNPDRATCMAAPPSWVGSVIPDCGEQGQWQTCAWGTVSGMPPRCNSLTSPQTQSCR